MKFLRCSGSILEERGIDESFANGISLVGTDGISLE
jgi:hypothetical protein